MYRSLVISFVLPGARDLAAARSFGSAPCGRDQPLCLLSRLRRAPGSLRTSWQEPVCTLGACPKEQASSGKAEIRAGRPRLGVAPFLCAPWAALVSLGIYAKHRLHFRLKGFQRRCPYERRMCAHSACSLFCRGYLKAADMQLRPVALLDLPFRNQPKFCRSAIPVLQTPDVRFWQNQTVDMLIGNSRNVPRCGVPHPAAPDQTRSFTTAKLNVRFRRKPPCRFRDRASTVLMTCGGLIPAARRGC